MWILELKWFRKEIMKTNDHASTSNPAQLKNKLSIQPSNNDMTEAFSYKEEASATSVRRLLYKQTAGYSEALQFWKEKEHADLLPMKPQNACNSVAPSCASPTLSSSTSLTSTSNSSRDISPCSTPHSLENIHEEAACEGFQSRERSFTMAPMTRTRSDPGFDTNAHQRRARIKFSSLGGINEVEETNESDLPSPSPLDSQILASGIITNPQRVLPDSIADHSGRDRSSTLSLPRLSISQPGSGTNKPTDLQKLSASLSARGAKRKSLNINTSVAPLSPKQKFVHCSFRGIKNFNVPLNEVPNVKDRAYIPQLLHDCVAFLQKSDIELSTIIDAQRKNVNNPQWKEIETMLTEKKSVLNFDALDNSDVPLVIQTVKWFFIHLPESILTNFRLRAFKEALEVDDDRICIMRLQTLIHSLPEKNLSVVRFMVEFFKHLVTVLTKNTHSSPSSTEWSEGPSSAPLSSSGSLSPAQGRVGYKTVIEKIFAAFYPMFLCHEEQDETPEVSNNNSNADLAGSSDGQPAGCLQTESQSRSRKKSQDAKKEPKRQSMAVLPPHKKEEIGRQLMGLTPNVPSPHVERDTKRQTRSDDFMYNRIYNLRMTTENLFGKSAEALEKRLFFLLITEYEKIFQCEQYGIQYAKEGNNIKVLAADPERLVHLILDPFYCKQDKKFAEIFFMTHEYYISKEDLLACLLNDLRKRTGIKPWECKHRSLILERLRQWISQEGLSIVKDRAFLAGLRKSLSALSLKATTTSAERDIIASSLLVLVNYHRSYDAMTIRERSCIGTSEDAFFKIRKCGPSVVAQQMTLLDKQMIKTICGSEFLRGAHMKADMSPNYHRMVEKFNQLSGWVAHEILSQQELSERVDSVQYFIKLIKELIDLSNYNSAYAIYLGLSMQVVTRLGTTWDKLNKKYALRYKRLARLFDMNFNFHEYRKQLDADREKCPIPVLALIPKDIIRFETDSTHTKNGQVDMEKMRGIWQSYFFLRQSQNNVNIPAIQRVEDVYRCLSESTVQFDEKQLNKLSKKCEPKFVKTAKKLY